MKTRLYLLATAGLYLVLLSPTIVSAQTSASGLDLPPGVTEEMIQHGDSLFHGKGLCTSCHGNTAEGMLGPDLRDYRWLLAKGTYLSILQVILNGVPIEVSTAGIEMPPRGGAAIDNDDVLSVAAYVWSLAQPIDVPLDFPLGVTNEMMTRGRTVFETRGQCASCHGSDATGDKGPDLTDDAWIHAKGSYLQILSTILDGVTAEKTVYGVPMPPRGGSNLTDAEVQAVAAFIWFISHEE